MDKLTCIHVISRVWIQEFFFQFLELMSRNKHKKIIAFVVGFICTKSCVRSASIKSLITRTMTGLKKKGKLQVVLGPMFSGKTSELIRRVQRYNLAGYRCLVVRYTHDNRYSTDSVATHDGMALNAILTSNLSDISHLVENYDVIGIDEGQFFPDIVEFCEMQSDNGKKVVVAALDGTYQRIAFGKVLGLIPLAEEVVKLNSICMSCSAEAPFTKRIGQETEVEVIGGADKYMSVCQDCYVTEPTVARSPFKNLGPPPRIVPMSLF